MRRPCPALDRSAMGRGGGKGEETYECKSNPKLIILLKRGNFEYLGGRRQKKPNFMREEIRNIKLWEWLLPVVSV